jgi:hypothetical protein
MTTDWLSGGFIIALAAVLWLVYLVPSWFRSRQYLATERNAVRLQQTLRILAETAEVPDEVRIEANARSIAEQERILKHRAAERDARAVPAAIVTADRLRRSRAVSAVVLGLSLVIAVLGGVQLASNGTWLLLATGIVVAAISVVMLAKLASAGRRLRVPLPEEYLAAAAGARDDEARDRRASLVLIEGDGLGSAPAMYAGDTADSAMAGESVEADDSTADGWVPVAMPRPLYLSRAGLAPFGADAVEVGADGDTVAEVDAVAGAPEPAGPAVDHEESLRRAAAASEAALRERMRAELETIAELPAAADPVPPVPPSRFARMGIVDDDTSEVFDLDAVLARRRAV